MRLLRGRVAVREILPSQIGRIHLPQDYHDKRERDRTSHRGVVLAMGPPMQTKSGFDVRPGFLPGEIVHFVWGASGCEKSRTGVWIDGEPCKWITQEEVLAVETGVDGPLIAKGHIDKIDLNIGFDL